MKRIIIQILLIIPAALIFNGRDFFGSISARSLGQSDLPLDQLISLNAFGFFDIELVSLAYYLFTLTIVVIYLFMFGHVMSDNLNVSDVYIFIRENKRTKWFIKTALKMFLQSAVIVTVNMAVVYALSLKMTGDKMFESFDYMLSITVMMIMYVWILLIITNFGSAVFGSTIGLSIGTAVHYIFLILARYTYDMAVVKDINPLACIFNAAGGRQSFITSVILLAVILLVVCTAFWVYVVKSDISLSNKETLV